MNEKAYKGYSFFIHGTENEFPKQKACRRAFNSTAGLNWAFYMGTRRGTYRGLSKQTANGGMLHLSAFQKHALQTLFITSRIFCRQQAVWGIMYRPPHGGQVACGILSS